MAEPEERAATDGAGDIHALLAELQEQMEASMRAQFAQIERAVAQRMAERLASADALIARLSTENARLQEERDRRERTLARLRELALEP